MSKYNTSFEYKPDESKADYLRNWYVELELLCKDTIEINQKGSYYFVGYGVGIVFFFLPETFGRKSSMKFILPIYAFAFYLTIYPKSLGMRAFGLFL